MPESRIPPQNVEAEQSILGALLIDQDAIVKVAEHLKSAHFYKEQHAEIYDAIISLYEKRLPVDLVTLTDELKSRKKFDFVGGSGYLTSLVNTVPTSAHIEHYASIVKDKATRRRLISASAKITELSFDEVKDVKDLLDESEQNLFGISQEHLKQNFVPIKDALAESFDRLDELHKKAGGLRGVPTGFADLDKKLSGMQESNLIILAARPSVGKTTLAMNIAQNAAVKSKVKVGIFSLEMSKEQLVDLMLSSEADVDAWRLTTGNLEEEDFQKLSDAMGELAEAPIFIDDTPGISIMEMRTKARRLQMEHGVDLIIVDYLQLVHGRNLENRVQEVSEISQALKNIARELKVPVLALSQLSRAVEARQAKVPQLADLRESGSIEQDADVVMFLYREDQENLENINLLIAKHRSGPLGEINLRYKGERRRFFSTEKQRVLK
ncbi:MAG: replicative DNA helicase [Patescibacteria group bacterium]|nr:replicative DNA helicase [Patescibacteria group bacterium]